MPLYITFIEYFKSMPIKEFPPQYPLFFARIFARQMVNALNLLPESFPSFIFLGDTV